MNKNIYLSEAETEALALLSKGQSYRIVREKLQIEAHRFPQWLAVLRRKTGITDAGNPEQVSRYLEKVQRASLQPTQEESQILVKLSEGATLEGTAYRLGISYADAIVRYESALRAIGVFATNETARSTQIKLFLATQEMGKGRPNTIHLRIMRALAEGQSQYAIADTLSIKLIRVMQFAREGCIRCGIPLSRGRNTQRNLIRAYFKVLDAKAEQSPSASEPVTMDDPMF